MVNTKEKDFLLELYFRDINETELLTREEEVALARKVREGDENSLNKLIEANLRFVVNIAKKYTNQGVPLSDLINEGNMGLIKAAYRFDETKGFKFISYAVWWIRQSITQMLSEQSRIVRLPSNRAGALYKIGKAMNELSQEYCRDATVEEIAERTGLRKKDVNSAIFDSYYISLDASIDDEQKNCLGDILTDPEVDEPDEAIMKKSLSDDIKRVLGTLDNREAEIISLYYGLDSDKGLTLDEIGKRLRISRERVRQIKKKAIERLKHSSRKKMLSSYVE